MRRCIAVASGIVVPLLMGKWTPMVAGGLLLATWIIAACVTALAHRYQATPGDSFFVRIAANRSSYYGMHLAHVGIAVFVIGVTLVKGYETERDVRMAPGQTVSEGGYQFKFVKVGDVPGPNYAAIEGIFEVSKDGKMVATTYSLLSGADRHLQETLKLASAGAGG